MSQQLSIGAMIKRISGLEGNNDLNSFEREFIPSMVAKTNNGSVTTKLTDPQVNIIEQIHKKYFA